jgi:putative transposase
MEDYLFLVSHHYSLLIHCFVLMPNHFHMMTTSPEGNLSQAMNYFMRETSREITRLSGRINQTYGARHHKSIINNFHYFMNCYKYVYRNPVRAGLIDQVQNYPYSTLAGICGQKRLVIPIVEDTLMFSPDFDTTTLHWLNQASTPEDEDEIRRALRRPVFALPKSRQNHRPSTLEFKLI